MSVDNTYFAFRHITGHKSFSLSELTSDFSYFPYGSGKRYYVTLFRRIDQKKAFFITSLYVSQISQAYTVVGALLFPNLGRLTILPIIINVGLIISITVSLSLQGLVNTTSCFFRGDSNYVLSTRR